MRRTVRIGLLAAIIVLATVILLAIELFSSPPLTPYTELTLPASEQESDLQAQWFGVSTLTIGDGETTVMIDGFFSRPSWLSLLFMPLSPDLARIDAALARGQVDRADALLVAHSHHDHAMDSAVVAGKLGARLMGSESTANIGRGGGLGEDQIRVIQHGDVLSLGQFEVRIFETPHSPDPVTPGTIDQPLTPPARLADYRLGENYSFLLNHPQGRILIVPSAHYVPGLFQEVQADVVFLSIGLLGKQPEDFIRSYWKETVQATGAKLVIPIHWDDFSRPLDQPLQALPYLLDDMEASMTQLMELAQTDGVAIRLMPLAVPVQLTTPEAP